MGFTYTLGHKKYNIQFTDCPDTAGPLPARLTSRNDSLVNPSSFSPNQNILIRIAYTTSCYRCTLITTLIITTTMTVSLFCKAPFLTRLTSLYSNVQSLQYAIYKCHRRTEWSITCLLLLFIPATITKTHQSAHHESCNLKILCVISHAPIYSHKNEYSPNQEHDFRYCQAHSTFITCSFGLNFSSANVASKQHQMIHSSNYLYKSKPPS